MKRSVACLAVLSSLLIASPASAKPSLGGVKDATAISGQSLADAIEAVRDGKTRRAVAQFDVAEAEARVAAIKARRLTALRPVRGSQALRVAAANADLAFADLSELIALLPPHAQAVLAGALGEFASIRADLIAHLSDLAEQLPEPARAQVLEAIARFHDVADLDALFEAIRSPEVTNLVREQLAGIFEMLSEQLDQVFLQLEDLPGMLPPEVAVIADDLCGLFDSLPIRLPIDIPGLCR